MAGGRSKERGRPSCFSLRIATDAVPGARANRNGYSGSHRGG